MKSWQTLTHCVVRFKRNTGTATHPNKQYHFHTGRYLAAHLGYDTAVVAALPDVAV